MCTTCGCGSDEMRTGDDAREHEHRHADGTVHRYAHDDVAQGQRHHAWHGHVDAPHRHDQVAPEGNGGAQRHARPAHDAADDHAHGQGFAPSRMLRVEEDMLARNDALAAENRSRLAERGVYALNLVSSPGSGKTTLLAKTVEALGKRLEMAVIVGDQQTDFDAMRLRASGARAVQINTGKGCHLDAHRVAHALEELDPREASVLFIENVGNLVCPAAFDLGEAHKVVVLSVTEGEDKPLKYPDMFRRASLMLLNKIDLLPYLQFDLERCIAYARRVNPRIEIIRLSAASGEGMGEWFDWLAKGAKDAEKPRDAERAVSEGAARADQAADREQRRRLAELEAEVALPRSRAG